MDSRPQELTKAIIAHHLGLRCDHIQPSQRLRRDYGFDNLALIGIALELEGVLQVEFPFAALEHLDTVSDLVKLVSGLPAKLAAQKLSA